MIHNTMHSIVLKFSIETEKKSEKKSELNTNIKFESKPRAINFKTSPKLSLINLLDQKSTQLWT